MKTNTQTKWAPSKISLRRPIYKLIAFILLALAVGLFSFFGLNFVSVGISGALLMLMLFARQESEKNTTEGLVNSHLEFLRVVQTSEGKPELLYDKNSQLIAVRLSGKEYQDPVSYSNYGDDVYVSEFETEEGLLVVVIEGKPNTKNQKAIAYKTLMEEE